MKALWYYYSRPVECGYMENEVARTLCDQLNDKVF